MPPKKKRQLKPVARGFATTSIPKKVDPEASLDQSEPAPDQNGSTANDPALALHAGAQGATTGSLVELDPVKLEEQRLQGVVDKLQDKTEKDVVRNVKAIDDARRSTKGLSRVDIDPILRDRILDLAMAEQIAGLESLKTRYTSILETEDKALPRLGITYGTLRRLGFSDATVMKCLESVSGVDLDEAMDWLYLHCDEEELLASRRLEGASDSPKASRASRTPSSQTPTTPVNPLPPAGSLVAVNSSDRPPGKTKEAKEAFLTNPALAAYAEELGWSDADSNSSGKETPDDPNIEFAQLKLRLAAKTQKSAGTSELAKLRDRMEALKGHYFFKQSEADGHFKQFQKDAHSAVLQSRLRGLSLEKSNGGATSDVENKPEPSAKSQAHAARAQNPSKGSKDAPVTDALDDLNESDEGFFGTMLDEMPTTETSSSGILVNVRDLGNPKNWSGRAPKKLLQETVQKWDRYAVVSYRNLSGESRAIRFSITISWTGAKIQQWSMEDVGCPDERQAEEYISVVALHAITFPIQDGFASATPTASAQTYFRLLPPIFRDIWQELEAKRKEHEASINRRIWSKLQDVLKPKLSLVTKSAIKEVKQVQARPDLGNKGPQKDVSSAVSEQLMSNIHNRQMSTPYQEMLIHRNALPIAAYRNEIITTLEYSQVIVLSGETGCGKSTQLPSFILEDQLSRGKPCKIYCTEPRRISAISLAQRVSRELGEPPGAVGTNSSLVGYSIRLESNTSRSTRLCFCTNGIALRMLESGSGQGGQGTAFDDITHVVIDEVHERSIESDFLLIVLKSLLQQRRDLKVILMSATMDAQKVANFFGGCPTFHVPGRTFPVDIRYLEDAIEYSGWSIDDGSPYAKRGNDKFHRSGKQNRLEWNEDSPTGDDEEDESPSDTLQPFKNEKRYSPNTVNTVNLLDERLIPYDLIARLMERICFEDPEFIAFSAAILIFMPGINEIRRLNDLLTAHKSFGDEGSFLIYPLHSSISSENQGAAFDIPPPGVRKIVIATNIAETGITIPDVTAVIDTGKHREMRFNEKSQTSRLVETFIARSNAVQRRGRAGRVQNGLCFHLFTKQRHDTLMVENPLPEMLRLSLSDLALRIKILKVKIGHSIEDVLSRAMDPPSSANIQRATSSLVEVKALTPSEEITPMGRLLSKLPTEVHLGKFLLMACIFKCLDPALTIAATLNAKSPFITPFGEEEEADKAKQGFRVEHSDFLTIHAAFASWRRASNNGFSFIKKFCRTNYLSHSNLQQIEELRQQFLGYLIDAGFIRVDKAYEKELNKARWSRGKTKFVTVPAELDKHSSDNTIINVALGSGLYPKVLAVDQKLHQIRAISNQQVVYFHPSSINFRRSLREFDTNYLCYFTIVHSKKLYAWETGPLDDLTILIMCGDADFKLSSDTVIIDRKIKYQLRPKTAIALKHLREQVSGIMATRMRNKPLSASQEKWNELAMKILGRKLDDTPV